jgi:hypothetical protein
MGNMMMMTLRALRLSTFNAFLCSTNVVLAGRQVCMCVISLGACYVLGFFLLYFASVLCVAAVTHYVNQMLIACGLRLTF